VSELLTLEEVAQRLHVSRTTCWRLVRNGDLPSVRITGSVRRVDSDDLEAWIDERRERGRPLADVVTLQRGQVGP
jgi:excisionase family DNA binding protein